MPKSVKDANDAVGGVGATGGGEGVEGRTFPNDSLFVDHSLQAPSLTTPPPNDSFLSDTLLNCPDGGRGQASYGAKGCCLGDLTSALGKTQGGGRRAGGRVTGRHAPEGVDPWRLFGGNLGHAYLAPPCKELSPDKKRVRPTAVVITPNVLLLFFCFLSPELL